MKGLIYFVYITTNPGKTTLYIGVTNDLSARLYQHYQNRGNKETFAGKYFCYNLLYYETFMDMNQAILREKELKNLTRSKKEDLIRSSNPKWDFIKI
jgi:putative endonuclease